MTPVNDRVLARMRATALPALLGGGMATGGAGSGRRTRPAEPGGRLPGRGCRNGPACHNVHLMQARSFRPEILVLVT